MILASVELQCDDCKDSFLRHAKFGSADRARREASHYGWTVSAALGLDLCSYCSIKAQPPIADQITKKEITPTVATIESFDRFYQQLSEVRTMGSKDKLPTGAPVDPQKYGRHAADTLRTADTKDDYPAKHAASDEKK